MIRKAMVLLAFAVLCALTGAGCASSKPPKNGPVSAISVSGDVQGAAKPETYLVGVGDILDISVYNLSLIHI